MPQQPTPSTSDSATAIASLVRLFQSRDNVSILSYQVRTPSRPPRPFNAFNAMWQLHKNISSAASPQVAWSFRKKMVTRRRAKQWHRIAWIGGVLARSFPCMAQGSLKARIIGGGVSKYRRVRQNSTRAGSSLFSWFPYLIAKLH